MSMKKMKHDIMQSMFDKALTVYPNGDPEKMFLIGVTFAIESIQEAADRKDVGEVTRRMRKMRDECSSADWYRDFWEKAYLLEMEGEYHA